VRSSLRSLCGSLRSQATRGNNPVLPVATNPRVNQRIVWRCSMGNTGEKLLLRFLESLALFNSTLERGSLLV